MRKQHLVKSTPRNEPNKRKRDGPTPEQMASRRQHYETV